MHRTRWYAAAAATLLLAGWLGPRYLAPVDREAWLDAFSALRRHMAQHYANLDWMVSHRGLDLPALTESTEARLRSAVVRVQAEGALRDFLAAFRDPHLRLESLPKTPRSSHQDPVSASTCEELGYRKRSYRFEFPFAQADEWLPISDKPFAAGTMGSLGVLRISHFGEDGYLEVCQTVGIGIDRRETQARVRSALQSELGRLLGEFRSLGIDTLLVDLTGNGGGSDWVVDASTLFSSRPIVRTMVAMRQAPCDRMPIWGGHEVCSNLGPPTTSALPGRGVWTGRVVLLVDSATASASEDFVVRLRESDVAQVIGERTHGAGCGYVAGGQPARLTRIGLLVHLPNCARFTRDGENEVEGLEPDIPIPVSSGTSNEKLTVLRAALDRLDAG